MQGAITKEITLVGDIAKVALIGAAGATVNFTFTGQLTKYQTAYFGSQSVSFGFDIDGTITKLRLFPESEVSVAWTPQGSLSRIQTLVGALDFTSDLTSNLIKVQRLGAVNTAKTLDLSGVLGAVQYLSGDVEMSLTPDGQLSIYVPNYIGYQTTGMSFAVAGTLQQTMMLSGDISVGFDATGVMQRTQFMVGAISNQLILDGSLSNNASIGELDEFLMVRRKTIREMTR